MFRRRVRPSTLTIIKVFLWPKSGWSRAVHYFWHRLNRLPGTPHSIAAGLASGAAASVTPFLGLHFFIAAAFSWLIGGNVLASTFGTIIGNPWTFPVIWISTYYIGNVLLGNGLPTGETVLNFSDMFGGLVKSMIEMNGALFMERVWPVLWPMMVGSIPSALLTWALIYGVFYRLVEIYQRRRNMRRLAKAIAITKANKSKLGVTSDPTGQA